VAHTLPTGAEKPKDAHIKGDAPKKLSTFE